MSLRVPPVLALLTAPVLGLALSTGPSAGGPPAPALSAAVAPGSAPASAPPPAPASLDDDPALAGLAARWSAIMDLFDTPGMVVAVVHDGRISVQGFGVRDPESGRPVTPRTIFYIASITKTFTAAGIEVLAGEGLLGLDDPVRRYLPRLRLPDSTLTRTLTVRDLLCHRPGIASGPAVLLDAYTGEITEDRYYRWLAEADLAGVPTYSNVHFTLLGRVIEAVSGEPWRDFLARSVFEPAGLTRTTGYMSRIEADPDHAVPCERDGDRFRPVEQRKSDRTMHAAGGLGTSGEDAARWLLLNLDRGSLDGVRVLPESLVAESGRVQARFPEPDGTIRIMEGFGLAWQVGTFNGRRLLQHAGGYAGASAYMALLPDDGVGVAVLLNAAGAAQGLGTIVAIDALERLTGTTSAWNVYDRYTARAREMQAARGERASEAPPPPPELAAAALSRPVGLYPGRYRNPDWGTLTVTRDADTLRVSLGDAPLTLVPPDSAAAGADRFGLAGLRDDPIPGAFLVGAGGDVDSLRLEHPRYGEVVFRR